MCGKSLHKWLWTKYVSQCAHSIQEYLHQQLQQTRCMLQMCKCRAIYKSFLFIRNCSNRPESNVCPARVLLLLHAEMFVDESKVHKNSNSWFLSFCSEIPSLHFLRRSGYMEMRGIYKKKKVFVEAIAKYYKMFYHFLCVL